MPATPDQPATPVNAAERHASLDTLRGVAVLGILIMNIYAFAMPFAAYMDPLVMGGIEWYNLATWFATHVFADQKFMSIFSLLFGAGTVLMWERAMARGAGFGRIYYRRLFWLLVIGALHAYLVWFGDILFYYALAGMLVYPARKWQPRTLIIAACLMLPVAPLLSFASSTYLADLQQEALEISAEREAGNALDAGQLATLSEWQGIAMYIDPGDSDIARDLEAYRGSYSDILAYRVPLVAGSQLDSFLFFILWRVGGLMLLGMALMKSGLLSGTRDAAYYRKLMLIGYGLGLPLLVYSCIDLYAHHFDGFYLLRAGTLPNYAGSILIAFGHTGLVIRLLQKNVFPSLMQRLAAVGRMAFSNYLLHSIVMTSIFYGYGLGQYGEVPRATQMLFVFAMFGLQLWFSAWWLERYRFGPAEWLWRTLTYWQRQPLRRRRGAARRGSP